MRRTIGLSLALLIVSMMVAAVAKQAQSAQHQTSKEKHAKADAATIRSTAKAHKVERKATTKHASRRETPPHRGAERTEPPDQYLGPLQVVGKEEVGSAAWYGPRHLGHRTASGDRLDASRATAAHRSLPLNSLARVTNLKNGRSVIVKVTDRGPWSSKSADRRLSEGRRRPRHEERRNRPGEDRAGGPGGPEAAISQRHY